MNISPRLDGWFNTLIIQYIKIWLFGESKMPIVWTKDKPNLLAPENLAKMQEALQKGTIIACYWPYRAAVSFDKLCFSNFEQVMNFVAKSTPGDGYSFWSLTEALERNLPITTIRFENAENSLQAIDNELEFIRSFLSEKYKEIAVVFEPLTNSVSFESHFYDIDMYDEFVEDLKRFSHTKANIYIFDSDAIFGENGKEELFFLDTQYPNAQGEVPINIS